MTQVMKKRKMSKNNPKNNLSKVAERVKILQKELKWWNIQTSNETYLGSEGVDTADCGQEALQTQHTVQAPGSVLQRQRGRPAPPPPQITDSEVKPRL